ncbi:hypothetical protein [Mycobacterium cookii]|nr:hypothetical protein [Mycobacterium cookii]MCV7329976.1 hypothetical protein [Mycobacterium cookii]
MTAKPEIEPIDQPPPATPPQATSPADKVREPTRIAAMLRDRFGVEG